jgi:protein-arginine kinase activator protein McsA
MSLTLSTITMTTTTTRYRMCDDCDHSVATHQFVGIDETVYELCESCNEAAWRAQEDRVAYEEEEHAAEEEEEELGICVSCEKQPARVVFNHMTNGNFELCGHCFEWADHEADYGVEFGCSSSEDGGEY